MIGAFFNTVFYNPLYNGLVLLVRLAPGGDVGVAIIILTLVVKFILSPLAHSSLKSQKKMKEIEPEIKVIQEKYKDDKQEQARRTMELYKLKKVNPFIGILAVFIQIPIIIELYRVFLTGGLPLINAALLYPFIHTPAPVSMNFLGLLDVSKSSLLLALLAGVSQYFQAKFNFQKTKVKAPAPASGALPSFQDQMTKTMSMQMIYVLPFFVFLIAWRVSGAVALYWVVNNIFSIGQEFYIRRSIKKQNELDKKIESSMGLKA